MRRSTAWRSARWPASTASCGLEQVEGLFRPENTHFPRTRLLCLENTHNRGGGRIQPYETLAALCRWAREHGLRTHLDGARLLNAVVATGIAAARWAEHFDTVNVCFSKGLGAPVGSALAGPRDLIREAVRHRKVLGGGMRQAGVLAAAALYALDHHIERLAEDHANARRLAAGIRQIPGLRLDPDASTRTSCSSRSIRRWAPRPSSASGCGMRALDAGRSARPASGPSRTWT